MESPSRSGPSDYWYVVYDRKDGRVVHTHQFIDSFEGDQPTDAAWREDFALRATQPDSAASPELRVLAVPADHPMEPGVTYRVEVESGKLIVAGRARLDVRG